MTISASGMAHRLSDRWHGPGKVATTARKLTHLVAEGARWVEYDETSAAVLRNVNSPIVTGMGVIDGAVTLFDGWKTLQKGVREHDRALKLGGLGRLAFGAWGLVPGVLGCYGEIGLGLWCTAEGIIKHNTYDVVNGLTQIGLAGTIAAFTLGFLAPPIMIGLVAGIGAGKLAFNIYDHRHGETLPGEEPPTPPAIPAAKSQVQPRFTTGDGVHTPAKIDGAPGLEGAELPR